MFAENQQKILNKQKPSNKVPSFTNLSYQKAYRQQIQTQNKLVAKQSIQENTSQNLSQTQAIQLIIQFSKENNNLIQKYNEQFFVQYFDRHNIEKLQKIISNQQQMKIQDFVRKIISFLQHKQHQTLFLIISIIDVFNKIKASFKSNENTIRLSDFTAFICDKISSKDQQQVIPLKQIADQKKKPDPLRMRSIDLSPPLMVSQFQKQIPQIIKDKRKMDKKTDPLKSLSQFFISPSLNQIITLGSLSSVINIFSLNFQKRKQIQPQCFRKLQKQLAILSFAFSQKQQRIGAVINNVGLAFWDFYDHFRTEKIIQQTKGTKIFYLPLADQWVTSDHQNVYYWDLKDEKIKAKIQQKSKTINDLCQITHIRGIAVSYTMLDSLKWVIVYQPSKHDSGNSRLTSQSCLDFKRICRINLSPSGCHTIFYNRFTQVIIPLGYKNNIPIYEIDNKCLDISLVSQLKGHSTIVTCICQVPQSDIIFTGDDAGHVIVWTLSNLRCQQLIRISKEVNSLKCFGNMLYYGDTRINKVRIEGLKIVSKSIKNQKIPDEISYGIFKNYNTKQNKMFLFTKTNCKVINMINGRTEKIVQICADDEQILVIQNYFNGYILGNSKGDIIHYSLDMQLKWRLSGAHSSDITQFKMDHVNKFLLSNGLDGNIKIWSQKTLLDEGPRKSLLNNDQLSKQVTCMTQLSQKFGIFITCSFKNQIRIWDYQSCRLIHLLEIQSGTYPVCIKICTKRPMLVVGTNNQKLLVYRFQKKDGGFRFHMVSHTQLANKSHQQQGQKEWLMLTNVPVMKKKLTTKLRFSQKDTKKYIEQPKAPIINDQSYQNSVQQILLNFPQNDKTMLICYGKGNMRYFSLEQIICQHFPCSTRQYFKKSANVQRPITQSLQKQLQKSHLFSTNSPQILPLPLCALWDFKIHKDLITHVDWFQAKYISSLCKDGYYKLIELRSGQVFCSLNINLPLPVMWNYKQDRNFEFCRQVHQALIIVDRIFESNKKLTKDQLYALNVKTFLDQVCAKKDNFKKTDKISSILSLNNSKSQLISSKIQFKQKISHRNLKSIKRVQILSDEFSVQDIKKTPQFAQTLKSFQVHKRIQKFINIRDNESDHQPIDKQSRKKNIAQQRQAVVELLSPNYLPKLLMKQLLTPGLVLQRASKSLSRNSLSLTKDDFKKLVYQTQSSFYSQNKKQLSQTMHQSMSKFKLPWNIDKINKLSKQIKISPINNKENINKENINKENINKENINIENINKEDLNKNSKKFANLSLNRINQKMESTATAMQINRAYQMKELCDKIHKYKKIPNIVKL